MNLYLQPIIVEQERIIKMRLREEMKEEVDTKGLIVILHDFWNDDNTIRATSIIYLRKR